MRDKAPKGETSKGQIRRLALVMALFVGLAVFLEAMARHLSPGRSAFIGLESAVTALAAWFTWHLIARRNNGIATFIISITIPLESLRQDRFPTFWFLLWVQVAPVLLIALLDRLITRKHRSDKEAAVGDLLYDGDLDQPSRPAVRP
jgi:hypothetical protein